MRCEDTQQWRLPEVDSIGAGMKTLHQLRGRIGAFSVERDLFHGHGGLSQDHLHGFIDILPDHESPQYVMPPDHQIERLDEPVETVARVEAEHEGREVRVAFRDHQMLEQNSFLERRERVDVLNVRGAAGRGLRDPVDLRLRQLHEVRGRGRLREPRRRPSQDWLWWGW